MPYLEQHVSVDATCICNLRESLLTLIGMPWKRRNWMGACADASGTTVGWEAQLKESSRHLHMVYFYQTIFVNKHPSRCWQLLLMLEGRRRNINGGWIMKSADAVWPADFWSLVIISDEYVPSNHRLCLDCIQIWFGFKSRSLVLTVGAFILQMVKSDVFTQILLWIITVFFFSFLDSTSKKAFITEVRSFITCQQSLLLDCKWTCLCRDCRVEASHIFTFYTRCLHRQASRPMGRRSDTEEWTLLEKPRIRRCVAPSRFQQLFLDLIIDSV